MAKDKVKDEAVKTVKTGVKPAFVFNKQNYIIMIIAIAVIAIGFVLMAGTSDIYDFRKITLAPIIVLLGFGIGVYAIMKKS